MVGENGKKKWFDKDFKISAVKMVTEGGHKASEVARSLDIHPNMLYSWKRKYADNGEKAFVGKGHLTEMAALRRKLRNAEMELEILKKESAYSQNQQRTIRLHRFRLFFVSAQSNMPGAGSNGERISRLEKAA